MGISVKRPITVPNDFIPFDEIDVSFFKEIDTVIHVPIRHKFFGSTEKGCIFTGPQTMVVKRGDKIYNASPIMFYEDEDPDLRDDNVMPSALICVVPELWPKRVFIKMTDCNDCYACDANTCIACSLETQESSELVMFDIHRRCISSSLRVATSQIITTLQDVWESYKRHESNVATDALMEGLAALLGCKEVLNKEIESIEVDELPLPDGYSLEEISSGNFVLRFPYKDKIRKRSLRCKDEITARNVAIELDKLISGSNSDNKKALGIYKSLTANEVQASETAILESMLKSAEDELVRVKEELADTKRQLYAAQSINEHLTGIKKSTDGVLGLECSLDNLFVDEIKYQLLDTIKTVYDTLYSDTDRTSRRGIVLETLLKENQVTDVKDTVKDALYYAFYDVDVHNKKTLKDLENVGFEYKQNSDGHITICPKGHPEYSYSLSSTPGDYRSRSNELANIIRKLFK